MKEYPEVHQRGILSVENRIKMGSYNCDLGIQIANDGRIWICVDGVAFLRFKPMNEKTMESLRIKKLV